MIKKRKEALKYAREVLNSIPHINQGGCLISAYAMYKYLSNYYPDLFGSDIVIVQYARQFDDHLTNQNFILGTELNAVSATHFGLSINNGKTAFDSRGKIGRYEDYSDKYKLIIPHDQTVSFVLSALMDKTWNPSFDRKKYIPVIEEKLKIEFLGIKH